MTTSERHVTRRDVLCAGGVGAAGVCALLLAGCSSESGSSSTTSTSVPATSTSAAPTSSGASGGQTATSTSAATSPRPSGTKVADLSSIPVGGSAAATLNGQPIVLAQPTRGNVVGFSAICTHQGCTVNAGGAVLNCPCHGSTFNAFTGANLSGPAPSPLPAITVTVAGTAVYAAS